MDFDVWQYSNPSLLAAMAVDIVVSLVVCNAAAPDHGTWGSRHRCGVPELHIGMPSAQLKWGQPQKSS